MKQQKYERPAAVTAERSVGANNPCAGTTIPYNEYNNSSGRKQVVIEQLLLPGADNAIPAAQLLAATRFRNARDLQQQIERERSAGVLILSRCSPGGGCFFPASRNEIVKYERMLKRRALSTLRTWRTARRVLREVPGQTQITKGGN